MQRSFQPTRAALIMTPPAFLVLLLLSYWQVERLSWKQDLINQVQAQALLPPQALPTGPLPTEDWNFRNGQVTGHYLHDRTVRWVARARNGEPGMHLLTPFQRDDNGEVILVDRGYVSFEVYDETNDLISDPQETLTVAGLVRFYSGRGAIQRWFVPDDDLDGGLYYVPNPDAFRSLFGEAPAKWMLWSDGTESTAIWPRGKQWNTDIPNNHLEYAITWLLMALSLAVIFVLASLKPRSAPTT